MLFHFSQMLQCKNVGHYLMPMTYFCIDKEENFVVFSSVLVHKCYGLKVLVKVNIFICFQLVCQVHGDRMRTVMSI